MLTLKNLRENSHKMPHITPVYYTIPPSYTHTRAGTPPDGQEHHQRGGHATRRADMPPEGQERHHTGRNATRGAGTPPEGQEHHQTGRNATRRAGIPPDGQECHQTGRNTTTRAGTPPEGRTCHHTGRNATRGAGTPPRGQEHHHTGRNATRGADMPPHGQEHHQTGRNTTTRAGTPPEGRTCHHTGRNTTTRAGTPPDGQEYHQRGRNTTRPKQAGGLQIGLQFSSYRLMFNGDNSYKGKDAPFNPRIISRSNPYSTLNHPYSPLHGETHRRRQYRPPRFPKCGKKWKIGGKMNLPRLSPFCCHELEKTQNRKKSLLFLPPRAIV